MLTPPGWRQRNKVSFCTEVAQTWCFSRQSLIHVHTRDANGPGQRMPGAGLAKRAATSHSFKKSRALPLQEAKPPGNVQKRKQRGLASSPRGTDGLICTREPRDEPRRLPNAVLPTPPLSARHAAQPAAVPRAPSELRSTLLSASYKDFGADSSGLVTLAHLFSSVFAGVCCYAHHTEQQDGERNTFLRGTGFKVTQNWAFFFQKT